jgi:hypothetical protein
MKNVIVIFLIFALILASSCKNQEPNEKIQSPLPVHEAGEKTKTLGINIEPDQGSYIFNSHDESSGVVLKSITVNKGICDKKYHYPDLPVFKMGDPCLVISGQIQNMHTENSHIAMYARGYDEAGEQVAWTLDAAHITGQIGIYLEYEETGEFTLHLNPAENISKIGIYTSNYAFPPP